MLKKLGLDVFDKKYSRILGITLSSTIMKLSLEARNISEAEFFSSFPLPSAPHFSLKIITSPSPLNRT